VDGCEHSYSGFKPAQDQDGREQYSYSGIKPSQNHMGSLKVPVTSIRNLMMQINSSYVYFNAEIGIQFFVDLSKSHCHFQNFLLILIL
jgi:hypothetical protein